MTPRAKVAQKLMGKRYIGPVRSLKETVLDFVSPEPNTGCWLWTGKLSKAGYGHLRYRYKDWAAHRAAYVTHVGPIPDGLTLDHQCRVTWCVNPDHLRPMTLRENIALVPQRQTCPAGHPWLPETTYVEKFRNSRHCKICRSAAVARCKARKRAQYA